MFSVFFLPLRVLRVSVVTVSSFTTEAQRTLTKQRERFKLRHYRFGPQLDKTSKVSLDYAFRSRAAALTINT